MREQHLKTLRKSYACLLCLYPRAYRKLYAEAMEQTFNDLLQERARQEKSLVCFILWLFLDTFTGAIRENITMLTLQKGIIRITLITLAILMVPLLAMQFNEAGEVDWSLFDFVVMGVLLFSAQLAFLMIPRRLNNLAYKTAVGISVLVVFLLILINGAVGIIGNEGNPANLMYFGVILVGVIGAILSRLKPQGMALTLCAATCVQILVGGPGCLGG